MQNACQNCQRVSHRYFLALEKCHRLREREREREFHYVHPYLERHQELSQKLLLHPRLLQQLCKKQQTLCHPACYSQSANRKTRLLFSDGCLRKTKFTFPWQEWVYFLISNFLVGPSLLHSLLPQHTAKSKTHPKKNPLPGDRLESSSSSSLDRECSNSLGRIPHHKSSYSQRE